VVKAQKTLGNVSEKIMFWLKILRFGGTTAAGKAEMSYLKKQPFKK